MCSAKLKNKINMKAKEHSEDLEKRRKEAKALHIGGVSKRYIVCTDINYKNELTVISHEFTGIEDAKLFKEHCLETEKYKGKNLLILNVC
jgi:hypothetical protein